MKKVLILNAIIWASVILIGACLLKDSENYKYMLAVLLIGFSITNGVLNKLKSALKN